MADLIEEPQPKYEPDSDGHAPAQRTVQQQKKMEALIKQERRESGEQTNRSRSQSRRDRRRRIKQGIEDGKYLKTASLEALEEADANGELSTMQTFERIGPDSTSMDGPVTRARAERGEIPMRGTNPNQPYRMPQKGEIGGGSSLDDTDGLKLKLEANLDVEIELKASIRGDLTLSLFTFWVWVMAGSDSLIKFCLACLITYTPKIAKYLRTVTPGMGHRE